MKVTSNNYTKPEKDFIKIPIHYFYDEDDKVVIDEECMMEEFKEEILKVSRILNGRKESK